MEGAASGGEVRSLCRQRDVQLREIHDVHRVRVLIEGTPKLADRAAQDRMPDVRGDLGEWPQHISATQQIGARQRDVGSFTHDVAI